MAGARTKVDKQTLQMFDPEVDVPDHDRILVALYNDTQALCRVICEHEGKQPFAPLESGSFRILDEGASRWEREELSYQDAVGRTGKELHLIDPSPVRLHYKQMEVPMIFSADEQWRYARIVGFVDLGVRYLLLGWPHLVRNDKNQLLWHVPKERRLAAFEVKSKWPTMGNLIRQLNLYRKSLMHGFGEHSRVNFLVGPDDAILELALEHHYKLITFDQTATRFDLANAAPGKSSVADANVVDV